MTARSIALLAAMAPFALAQTGPEVGAMLPEFELEDQTGAKRDFASLAGPNGLLLLFHRSADW